MKDHGIYCMMRTGVPMSDAAKTALFQGACDCVLRNKKEHKIVNDDVNGFVTTDYQHVNMGGLVGIYFSAEVNSEAGETKVTFLVTANDIEYARNDPTAVWSKVDLKKLKKYLEKHNSYKNN